MEEGDGQGRRDTDITKITLLTIPEQLRVENTTIIEALDMADEAIRSPPTTTG